MSRLKSRVSSSRSGVRKTTRDQTTVSLINSALRLKTKTTMDQTTASSGTKNLNAKLEALHDDELDSPYIYPSVLDDQQIKIWKQFIDKDKDVAKHNSYRFRCVGESGGRFGEDLPVDAEICMSLAEFAVDTFNKSYQLFIRKKISAAIVLIKCLECFYFKMRTKYHFFMKLEATEHSNSIPRLHEVVVTCDPSTGARTLTMFRYDRVQLGEISLQQSETEEGESVIPATLLSETKEVMPDVPLIPVDLYEASGMMRRLRTNDFEFYNPEGIMRVNLYGGAVQNLRAKMQYA